MVAIRQLADLIDSPALAAFADPALAFARRDDIKTVL